MVNSLHKLPNHQRHALNALDLLLGADELALQTPLLILDVFFLELVVSAGTQSVSCGSFGPRQHWYDAL